MQATPPTVPNRESKLPAAPAYLLATFFGVGYCPLAPGTAGSVAAVLLLWPLRDFVPLHPVLFPATVALLAAAGVWAAWQVERREGREDPSIVVVDEVCGQWLAFSLLPVLTWKILLLGLVAFRVFDIFKPWLVRKAEKLPGGLGIMADDLLAGIYACVVVQAACRFFLPALL